MGLAQAALRHGVDLTVVGPEIPLAGGIVDHFQSAGLAIFGPTQAAARIESSKVFAKERDGQVLHPDWKRESLRLLRGGRAIRQGCNPYPLVVKADGLAAGKGVTVAGTEEEAIKALRECMVKRVFGPSGDRVLVEECLTGREVSVFAFVDGETVSPMVAACDYKRAYDGDHGPNTGGMGAYSPPEFWNGDLEREIRDTIMVPTVRAPCPRGLPLPGRPLRRLDADWGRPKGHRVQLSPGRPGDAGHHAAPVV